METPFGFLVVVCDGMGGGPAGANASIMAVQSIIQEVNKAAPAMSPEMALKNAIVVTNNFLRRTIREHQQLMGMGTTCVAALFTNRIVTVAHVGDSRLYLFREGKQLFRTADHSVVGEMVQRGELTEEDARRAKNSNVITRALGIADDIEVETSVLNILPNDRIALCTDGVWGMLPEMELATFLCKNDRIDHVLPILLDNIELVGKSKPNSNYDNLSLALVSINNTVAEKKRAGGYPRFLFPMLALLCLSLGANLYFYMSKRTVPHVSYNTPSRQYYKTERNEQDADDKRLEEAFAKRRQADSCMQGMQGQITGQEIGRKTLDVSMDQVDLINQIANDVRKLNTLEGKSVRQVRQDKRRMQQKIIKDFKILRNGFRQQVNAEQRKYSDVSKRLSGSTLIDTQQNGASTRAAREEISEVIELLNAMK